MEKWQISEFSKLTGVSVRTLHHYDRIRLLKSSERQSNGFRLYGGKNLEILLQILSLKFLGFELLTIKCKWQCKTAPLNGGTYIKKRRVKVHHCFLSINR